MKKLFTALLLYSCIMSTQMVSAQVSAYTFAQTTTNTYKQVGVGASLTTAQGGTTWDDTGFPSVITLPWSVTFHGATFTNLAVSPNGYAILQNSTTAAGSSYNANTSFTNVLSPLNSDLKGFGAVSGDVSYATTGETGNRILTVQWLNWSVYSVSANNFSFQIKIYEGSNKIQFVYYNGTGTDAPAGTVAGTVYTGLVGATSADFNLRTTTTSWTNTTAAASNSTAASSAMALTSTIRPRPTSRNGMSYTWTAASTVAAMAFSMDTTTIFVPIEAATSGTVLTNPTFPGGVATGAYDDEAMGTQTIPFSFNYAGSTFTTLGVNANGFIQFPSSSLTSSYSAQTSNAYIVAPLNADLGSQVTVPGRELSVYTVGTAPNRQYVIEWQNWSVYNGTAGAGTNDFSFQIRLFETTNAIQYCYGPSPSSATATVYVGLTGATTADFNVRGTSTSLWSASVAGTANSTAAANRLNINATTRRPNPNPYTSTGGSLFYSWTPPSCSTPSALAAGSITTTGATMTYTCTGCTGTNIIEYGPAATFTTPGTAAAAGTGGTIVTGASPIALSSLSPATQYRVFIRQNCGSGNFSANSTAVTFTTACNALNVPWTESFESLPATAGANVLPNCWSFTNTTGNNYTCSSTCNVNTARTGSNFLGGSWGFNVWNFTPGFNLTGGSTYTLTYYYKTNNSTTGYYYPSIRYGTAQTVAAMTNFVDMENGVASNSAYTQVVYNFTPASSGVYYLALHDSCPSSTPNGIAFDDFSLTGPCSGTPSAGTVSAFAPVTVSGFTADVIANGIGLPSTSTTAGADGVPNYFVASNFQATGSSALQTYALPASRVINSAATPGMSFNLMPYTGNNDLRLSGVANGTLTLASAQSATSVNLLYTVGNGPATANITVTFTDASTQVFSGLSMIDWYTSATNADAALGIGRVDATGAASSASATTPYLHQLALSLSSANYGKQVASVNISNTSSGTIVHVFAVTLGAVNASVPASCAPVSAALTLSNGAGLSNSGITYQWQSSTTSGGPYANIGGATSSTYTASANTTTYYVVKTTCANGGASALSGQITVNVNATPVALTVTPSSASINQGQTATFTASDPNAASYRWYTDPTGGSPIATTAAYTTPALCAAATYYVEGVNGTCISPSRTAASVLMNSNFLAFTSSNLICGSGSVNLTATALTPAPVSYTWSNGATGTGPIAVSPATSTQYTVSADFTTCTATASVNVGVIDASAASIPTASPYSQCHTGTETVRLNANVSSDSFKVIPITYAPTTVPGSGVTTLASGGTPTPALTAGTLDDGGWGAIPIGFNYNFFGNNYTTVNVGTNGTIQFGAFNSSTSGGLNQYSFSAGTNLPSTSAPANFIAGVAIDLDSRTSGTIKYWTTGVAPTRAWHLFYNTNGFSSGKLGSEIILYETTGIVDIVIDSASACGSSCAKLVGLQNATQTIGATAPGRGGAISPFGPESWRFIPPANYTFTWSVNPGNPAATTLTPNTHVLNPLISNITTPGTYVYNVAVTNPVTSCTNTSSDTFVIIPTPSAPTTKGDSTHCGPASVTFTVTSTLNAGDSVRWWTAATGGTLLTTTASATWATPTITADTAYYAEIWNGTCASSRTRTVAKYANALGGVLVVNRTPSTGTICVTGSVTLSASISGASTYTWSPGTGLSSTSGQTVTASPTANTTYTVVANFGVCTVSATGDVVYIATPTSINPTASPVSQCFAANDTVRLVSNLSLDSFTYSSLPYAPTTVPGTGVTTLVTGGVANVPLAGGTLDDGGWSGIPIGFSFDFLGNTYSSLNVGTNGLLQFGAYNATIQQYSFPLGFPNSSYPTNVIAPMAVDMYFVASGTLQYWTDGTAPNRKFHVYYSNVPGWTTNGLQTAEAILYETTGKIDVQIAGATSTSAKTVGIQNLTGTTGSSPERAVTAAIGPEGWRFIPPSTYTVSWVANPSNPAGAAISSSSALNPIVTGFTSSGTYIYTLNASNANTGCSASRGDTFVINRTPATPTTVGATTLCGAYPVTFTSTGAPDSIKWYSAATGGTLVGNGSPWTTPLITGDTAYYAQVTTGSCSSARVRTVANYTVPPSVSITGSNDLLCAGGSTSDVLTAVSSDPTYNFTWSGTGTGSGVHNQTYTVLPSGTTTYSVTGSNTGTGCNTVGTHVVQVNALPAPPTTSVTPNNVCPGSTVTLSSVAASTGYAVSGISYAPLTTGTGTTNLVTAGSQTVSLTSGTLDDGYWSGISLPFSFNFFGTAYTSVSLSTNGVVEFGTPFSTSGPSAIPNTFNTNFIAGAWGDMQLDGASANVKTYTVGSAPNRVFVINFSNVGFYDISGFSGLPVGNATYYIEIYENGVIETHIGEINNSTLTSSRLIGIEDNSGNGTAAPGRNSVNFSVSAASPEAWRFNVAHPITYLWTPNGAAGYMAAGQETLANATANPTSSTGSFVYTSTITDVVTTCSNSATATVLFTSTPTSNITGPSSLCQGVSGTYNVVFSGAGPWSYTIDTVGGTISGTSSSNTVIFTVKPATSKTVRLTSLVDNSTGCTALASGLDTQRIVTTTNCSITWLGAADTSWSNPNNWTPVLIPNSCSVDVTIPAGTPNQPSITAANIQVGNLTMGNNQRIKLNGKDLSVCKNFSGPSSAATAYNVVGSGKVVFNGSAAQTYNGYGTIDEVVVNNTSGGVTFANVSYARLSIYRGLHLQAGTITNSASGSVILLSNSADTVAWLNNFSAGYTGTFAGKLTVQRKVATTGTTWQHQMSAPVSGSGVTFNALGQSVYGWHAAAPLIPSSNCSEDSISWTSPYSTALTWHESNVNVPVQGQLAVCATRGWYTVNGPDQWAIGTGYSIYLTSASKVTLTGTPNTGNINIAGLTNSNWSFHSPEGNNYNSGWSLVGNPYPSSLDMTTSPLGNGFDNQIQIFQPTGPFKGSYAPAILGGRPIPIPAFQGFMIHKTATGGTATWQFLQSERTTGVGTGYSFRKTGDNNQLSVLVSGNGFNDITNVQFSDVATDGFDPEFDANKFASLHGQPTLYTLASGTDQWMGINVLGSFERSAIVPMGFSAGATGSFTFAVNNDDLATFDPSVNIYLEDKQNSNNWINLRNNSSYTFTASTTDAKERFVLHFEKTSTSINEVVSSNSNLNIFSVENKVLVDFTKLKNVDATIQIYNILGQELSNETHHASSTYVKAVDNVEAAYVIVKVKMADGSVTGTKLFITK